MTDNKFPIIQFINVSKRFNGKAILSKINLTIYRGETVGITGPIGTGKTTLLQIALGLITPDQGSVQIFNKLLETNRQSIMQEVNFTSSSLRLNGYSTIQENLLTFARLYGIKKPLERITMLAHQFHITHLLRAQSKIYTLSAGESATVNICKALLNNPTILFLDEATAHMDPQGIQRVHKELKDRKTKHLTTIWISQDIQELQKISDRIVVMKNKRIDRVLSKRTFKYLSKQYV